MANENDIIFYLKLHAISVVKFHVVFLAVTNSTKYCKAEKCFHFDVYFPFSKPLPLFGNFDSLNFSLANIVFRLLIFRLISLSAIKIILHYL